MTPLSLGGSTRLIIHAVADNSNLQWIPKVRKFMEHCVELGLDLDTITNVDCAVAEYFDLLCYRDQLAPSAGAVLFFGLLCLSPEWKGRLLRSLRALKSWHKLAITAEGGPIPEEYIFLIALYLFEHGFDTEGAWVLFQYDIFGR